MVVESARELAWIRDRIAEPFVEAPSAAIIATNLEGRVAYWNAAAERLYGWEAGEAVGRDILDLTPASYTRDQSAAIMAALRAGRRWQGEIGLRHRDGSPLRAFVVDIPVGDFDNGQGAIIGLSFRAERGGDFAARSAAACRAVERRFRAA